MRGSYDILLAVFAGGGLGSLFRYWLSGVVYRMAGQDFPIGTLAVNIGGSLLLGFLAEITESRVLLSPALKMFFTIGLCGGFTTYSTFSYETYTLISQGSWIPALINIGLSLLLCLAGIFAGIQLARIV